MKDYAQYLREIFGPRKTQKLSINLRLGCPNRDGTIGTGGCIYCNNQAFSPRYCHEPDASITSQIEEGIKFFGRKYPDMQYIAYFQNYTASYASLPFLYKAYSEALAHPLVAGIAIGTRPDCAPQDYLKMMKELPGPALIEYGAETSHDATLALINRGHTWECTADAVARTADLGLHCGLHLINGLPGESVDDMLSTVAKAVKLPVGSLKFHHLQILKGTYLAHHLKELPPVISFTPESYLNLCIEIVEMVPQHIAIERFLAQSPPDMVISPKWGLKNYQFQNLLHNRLSSLGLR